MSGCAQRGASILLVIFLLGGAAVLGIVVSTLAATQHFSVAYSARGAQAYFAARSGIQYAAARITAGAGCAGVAAAQTIEGFDVTLNCAVSGTFDEGEPTPYSIFDLTATASAGSFSAPDVTNRRLQATLKFP